MALGLVRQDGEVRTSMDCHQCSKVFVALVDFSLNGNHVIECPHCGHEHCRVVTDGVITGERWDSRAGGDPIKPRRTWKHDSRPIATSSASEFIRDRWLNRSDW